MIKSLISLTDIFVMALTIFRVYIITYRKTQEVKQNDLIEIIKLHEKMGITSSFIQKSYFKSKSY